MIAASWMYLYTCLVEMRLAHRDFRVVHAWAGLGQFCNRTVVAYVILLANVLAPIPPKGGVARGNCCALAI